MRFPTLLGAANAALLLDHSSHNLISWTGDDYYQKVSTTSQIKLFGEKKFSDFYINAYGTVTTDDPQPRLANSQTYSATGITNNIIFAPHWAAVLDTPQVYFTTSLSSSDITLIENEINNNRPNQQIRPFILDSALVATWTGMKETAVSDANSYQVILTSDGYFSYALYSYNGEEAPSWDKDADNYTPVQGILTHHRRMDLCMKSETTEAKDWNVGGVYGWNTYDDLDCSDCKSFTECGGMKEQDLNEAADANTQYTYLQYFKTLPASVFSHYEGQYYAVCQCNDGFSIDAAMNNIFERKCVYDPDTYSSDWESTEDENGQSRFTCADYESTKIQLDYGQPIVIDLSVWPDKFEFLLYIDDKKLPAKWRKVFFMLIKAIFEEVMQTKLTTTISVNLYPENYRKRRKARDAGVMLGNDDLGVVLDNFDDLMTWVDDWAPELEVDDIDEFLTELENTAEAVGAIQDEQVTTELDVILGIEDDPEEVSDEFITQVAEEGLLVMTNNTQVTETVKSAVEAEIEQERTQIQSNTACIGLRRNNGPPNPFWQKPDACCGDPTGDPSKSKPYLSSVLGCCELTNGFYRTYELSEKACCDGVILNQPACPDSGVKLHVTKDQEIGHVTSDTCDPNDCTSGCYSGCLCRCKKPAADNPSQL